MTETRRPARTESRWDELARIPLTIKHAFEAFLAVPTAMVAAFFLLAVATYALDVNQPEWLDPLRRALQDHLFADAESTSQVLSTIAGGIITLTSITFSLLLVALQQSAGSMTHAVFDQFQRRRSNQFYTGWFIGITLFPLITLATVSPELNPIYGATLALLFAISALYVLLLLVYSAIEQMRPSAIIESIHDHTLQARLRQSDLLRRTRRQAQNTAAPCHTVRATVDGFVTNIDLAPLAAALRAAPGAEVVLHPIGAYVAYGDPLAEIRGAPGDTSAAISEAVTRAVQLERERDLELDPAFGIEQIEAIAWTGVSTAKQDINPGLEAARNLRDMLSRWAVAGEHADDAPAEAPLPVVYPDDVVDRLMRAIESLMVVTSESMQHQVYAAFMRGLAVTFDRLPPPLASRAEEIVLRSLAGLGDHVLSVELEEALSMMAEALQAAGRSSGAEAVRAARDELAESVGRLNSRGTRVPER
jgi:uncharacterized membrane protein